MHSDDKARHRAAQYTSRPHWSVSVCLSVCLYHDRAAGRESWSVSTTVWERPRASERDEAKRRQDVISEWRQSGLEWTACRRGTAAAALHGLSRACDGRLGLSLYVSLLVLSCQQPIRLTSRDRHATDTPPTSHTHTEPNNATVMNQLYSFHKRHFLIPSSHICLGLLYAVSQGRLFQIFYSADFSFFDGF